MGCYLIRNLNTRVLSSRNFGDNVNTQISVSRCITRITKMYEGFFMLKSKLVRNFIYIFLFLSLLVFNFLLIIYMLMPGSVQSKNIV